MDLGHFVKNILSKIIKKLTHKRLTHFLELNHFLEQKINSLPRTKD